MLRNDAVREVRRRFPGRLDDRPRWRSSNVERGTWRLLSLEVDEQGRDVGRVDAADPARLAERARPDPAEFLAGLGPELRDRRRSRGRRDGLVLEPAEPLDLLGLAADVAAVLRLDRHLLDDVGSSAGVSPAAGRARRRSSQVVAGRRRIWNRRLAVDAGSVDRRSPRPVDRVLPGLEPRPAGVVDQADAPAELGQAEVGVVVPEQQPVLGPAREHPVGLVDAAGDQVVDQDADVRLRPVEDERPLRPRRRSAALTPAIRPWAAASS